MTRTKRVTAFLGTLLVAALIIAGCSSGGGKASQQQHNQAGAGTAGTPKIKIAMITHAVPGDTFWDQIRQGANAAAKKDNVQLVYAADPDGSKQATLIQNAINQHVAGIAVTMAHPGPVRGAIKAAIGAGIPVVGFNSGLDYWKKFGVMEYFGQDEMLAGKAFGNRLNKVGAKHVICVNQEQGSVQLEARCAGLKQAFHGKSEVLYVKSADMASVRSRITAKLQSEPDIDYVATLGAPFAMAALQSVKDSGSKAQVATFDTNKQVINAIKGAKIKWAVDQQPYLQGYLAVDSLWLYKYNGAIIGGGQPVLTGPTFVTPENIKNLARYSK
ncbi:MAG: substrate-binding domain-containing protein [Sciscionella sp.]